MLLSLLVLSILTAATFAENSEELECNGGHIIRGYQYDYCVRYSKDVHTFVEAAIDVCHDDYGEGYRNLDERYLRTNLYHYQPETQKMEAEAFVLGLRGVCTGPGIQFWAAGFDTHYYFRGSSWFFHTASAASFVATEGLCQMKIDGKTCTIIGFKSPTWQHINKWRCQFENGTIAKDEDYGTSDARVKFLPFPSAADKGAKEGTGFTLKDRWTRDEFSFMRLPDMLPLTRNVISSDWFGFFNCQLGTLMMDAVNSHTDKKKAMCVKAVKKNSQ